MAASAVRLLTGTMVAAAMVSTAAFAQSGPTLIQPKGSVEATPIEIPGKGKVSATPIEIPGKGRTSATPIEIPGKGQTSTVAVLPLPLPGPNIEQLDPRAYPDRFMVMPIPLPDPVSMGMIGRNNYQQLADGRVMGQTAYGYAMFMSMDDYQRFLRSH